MRIQRARRRRVPQRTPLCQRTKGRRIQILRFANGIHGAVECLQIIPSPYGMPLAGLCVSGDRLWCLGQARGWA